jgi:hypothetical protein
MLRIPPCLDTRLTDGGKVVILTQRPRSTPQKHFSTYCTHFCYRLSKLQGPVRLEGLGKLKKKKKLIHLIGSRIRDLPACSVVPYPLRYQYCDKAAILTGTISNSCNDGKLLHDILHGLVVTASALECKQA